MALVNDYNSIESDLENGLPLLFETIFTSQVNYFLIL